MCRQLVDKWAGWKSVWYAFVHEWGVFKTSIKKIRENLSDECDEQYPLADKSLRAAQALYIP